MKIAITGSDGLVGSRITELLSSSFTFLPTSFDVTNKRVVGKKISSLDFDVLLHLAAYTNVDGAEKERDIAQAVNVEGTRNVFEAVTRKKKQMIYISTDFVFDGERPPFDEKSKPNPISYYGWTKYEGERIVWGKAMIVRLSYPYRAAFAEKKDFFRTIRDLLAHGDEIKAVADSTMTPTFIDDIAFTLKELIANFKPEVYHVVGADSMSPYEAATTIARVYGYNTHLIKPVTYDEFFKGRARRPHHSHILTSKNIFHKMKKFEEGLHFIKGRS